MIIVSNLIKGVYLVLCIIFFAMELIAFFVLLSLYDNSLTGNNENILIATKAMTNDSLNTFNSLLSMEYINFATDILTIGNHIYPFYLTQSGSKQKSYLQYTQSFIGKFGGCLAKKGNSSQNKMNDYLSSIDYSFSNENQISEMLSKDELNEVDYYTPNKVNVNDAMEKYVCFSMSVLKSLLIRNFMTEQENLVSLNYSIYIGNNAFAYPSYNILSLENIINNDLYYIKSDKGCQREFSLKCLNIPQWDNVNVGDNETKEIIINEPVIKNSLLYSRGCIEIPYDFSSGGSISNSSDEKAFACITFNISSLLNEIRTPKNSNVNLTIIKQENDDIYVYYFAPSENSNGIDNIAINFKNIYNKNEFGKYQINEDREKYPLFNYLFYYLIKANISKTKKINKLLSQYDHIKNYLIDEIKKYDEMQKDILCKESFYNYSKTIYYNLTTNQDKDLYDDFYFVFSPILLQYTKYNTSTYKFTNQCKGKILFFSLGIAHVGTVSISKKIYNLLVYKSVRSILFFVFLNLACLSVFYLIMYYYLSYLLNSINSIKSKLAKQIKLIKDKKNKEQQSPLNDKDELDVESCRNIETKEIFKVIETLSQILLVANYKGINYALKLKLYNTFYLNMRDEKLKKNCEFLIGYFNLKNGNYTKAEDILSLFIQKLEIEQKNLLKQKSNLEINTYNLPMQVQDNLKYINDYSKDLKLSDNTKKYFHLKQFLQKAYYLLGLSKYLEFISNKKQIKTAMQKEIKEIESKGSDENIEKAKEKRIERAMRKIRLPENKILLDKAITALSKSREINQHMKVNVIKTIFTEILISKCYYELNDYPTAAKYLKDTFINLAQFAQMMNDKRSDSIVINNNNRFASKRIMLIAYSLITENLLYYIAKICIRKDKPMVATYILSRLLELNIYISDSIQNKTSRRLRKLILANDLKLCLRPEIRNEFYKKMTMRTNVPRKKKALAVLMTDKILNSQMYELLQREVIFGEIKTKFAEEDVFLLAQLKDGINEKVVGFLERDNFLAHFIQDNLPYNTIKHNPFNQIIQKILECYDKRSESDDYDKVIFAFLSQKDIESFSQFAIKTTFINLLNEKNIGLYIFSFHAPKVAENYLMKFEIVRQLIECFLITTTSFNVIKIAFENISRLKPQTLVNFYLNFSNGIYSGKN